MKLNLLHEWLYYESRDEQLYNQIHKLSLQFSNLTVKQNPPREQIQNLLIELGKLIKSIPIDKNEPDRQMLLKRDILRQISSLYQTHNQDELYQLRANLHGLAATIMRDGTP